MNDRQRFNATMHYQPRDRSPICDFSFWSETIEVWHEQGLPRSVTHDYDCAETNAFFGMDPLPRSVGCVGLAPTFDSRVIEDRGEYEVVQQDDGVRVLRKKFMGSIPMHEGHLLIDRPSWEKHYKPRLDPNTPARFENNWDQQVRTWADPDRDYPLAIQCGSLYGRIRDWMGMEAISYVVYDDPAWFEEMVTTCADMAIGVLERILATDIQFDAASFWEDMCYNSGPLLSPTHFKRFLVPQYQRITDLLHKHDVDVVGLDCDGKIDDLIPLWLDVGVNCMIPMEVGTWHGDPVQYRRSFGKELLMMGGFDKHILAQSCAAIQKEVYRLEPLVEKGGYIPFCDHRVPPDVPLSNYMFYLEKAREVWGHNVNLKPMGSCSDTSLATP